MDHETFRQKILDGEDQLINSRLWRFLNSDQQKMMLAARAFWAANTPATNAALDDYLVRYQNQQEESAYATSLPNFCANLAKTAGIDVSAKLVGLTLQYLLGRDTERSPRS